MMQVTPSRTARKVALNLVTLGAMPETNAVLPPGIAEATAQLLVSSGAVGLGGVSFSRSQMAVWAYLAFDWMLPGQFVAFAHRKAFCERQVREGISGGAGQVLVLGAGYDTLGWRLAPEFPDVTFFEIDHPATARFKARGIAAMGVRDNLHLMAEDLTKRPLQAVLSSGSEWDMTASSVIVAEGLLMYLPPESVEDLLQQCAAACGADSRFVFTYVGRRADGRPDAGPRGGWILWMLEAGGEPWLWSIHPEEIEPFIRKNNWEMAPREFEDDKRHGIEFFGVAVK